MNSGTLREIQQELNKLVEWQDERDAAVSATEVVEMLRAINPSEWLSVLDPRIQASKARLRALLACMRGSSTESHSLGLIALSISTTSVALTAASLSSCHSTSLF